MATGCVVGKVHITRTEALACRVASICCGRTAFSTEAMHVSARFLLVTHGVWGTAHNISGDLFVAFQ